MTSAEYKIMVEDIVKEMCAYRYIDDPRGFGYITIESYDYTTKDGEDLKINLFIDVCKYKDPQDGHLSYGAYTCAEIDGGDNIMEHDYEYTKDCSQRSLYRAIKTIVKNCNKDMLAAECEKYLKKIA